MLALVEIAQNEYKNLQHFILNWIPMACTRCALWL